ncbi:hypothetical protein JDS99_26400 [Bacillus cereus group sp. N6]|uniref:hypothetical protein n=1 Tax=Bacillus cereus group sp. N6 TaxID=2794583 RepID=UPI0018F6C661|nr:hypothetical protein [Bacillus cereus group sp. N6]MBJ8113112.1 hypothetical protein [Bacillus cereus group sp. N6]
MNGRTKRIRILDLQDRFCQICEHQIKPLKECIQYCAVANELQTLASELFEQSKRWNSKEEWDDICQQAIKLYIKGIGINIVAEKLGYPSSTLRDQLKKRGLWKKTLKMHAKQSKNKM